MNHALVIPLINRLAKALSGLSERPLAYVHTDKGFTITEALIVAGISSVIVLGVSNAFIEVSKATKKSNLLYQIQSLKEEVSWALRDPNSWTNTLANANNVELACVQNHQSCAGVNGPVAIDINNSANQVILSSRTATSGFTWDGVACNTFDAVNGDDTCPLRLSVDMTPLCADANCLNPGLELSIQVAFNPATKMIPLNTTGMMAKVYKDPMVDSLQANCISLNGTFDTNTGVCTLDTFSATCKDKGEYLAGVNNGVPICQKLPAQTLCPKGQWIQGFDVNGGAICATI